MMSIANPLTVSTEIQKANINVNSSSQTNKTTTSSTLNKFGEFSQDIVDISSTAREKQQAEQVVEPVRISNQSANQKADQESNDSVEVSSSLGKSKAAGNLTRDRASALYNAIAALL